MKIVSDWKLLWRTWSMRINALGLAIMGWVTVDPTAVLMVWNMLPVDIRDALPTQLLGAVGISLFGLSMIAKLVRQPKLEEKRDEAANP